MNKPGMNTWLARLLKWTREGVLTGGAVLGLVCLLVTLAGVLFGVRPLVFESGSMSPTIDTGALAISHRVDASTLQSGQIVSVPTGTGQRVTHRIVTVTRDGDAALLVLRGDANHVTDQQTYRVTQADRVLFAVPSLGYAVGWLMGPIGLFLLGLYAAFLLSVLARKPPRHRGATQKFAASGLPLLLVVGMAAGVAAPMRVTPTLASWTDAVPVSGTTLSGYVVPAPVISSCSNTPAGSTSLRHVTLTWPAVTSPVLLDYAVAVDVDPAANATITTVSPNKQVDIAYNPGSTTYKNKRVTVSVTAHPSGVLAWVSPADTWQFQTPNNNNQATCGEKVPPTVVITAPDATTRTAAAEVTFMGGAAGCANNSRPACGTMSDGSSITNVDYILQRVQGGSTTCWTGAAYSATCGFAAATIASSTTWRLSGSNATVYATPGGAFTLTVRVTDTWGNQTTLTRSFTVTP